MTPRDSSGNLPATLKENEPSPRDRSPATADEESANDAEPDTNRSSTQPEASASFVKPQAHEPKRHLRKKIDYDLQALAIGKRKIDLFEQHVSRKTHKYQDDEDYSFFISLLPTVKQLNQLEKMKRRMKILGDVTEALEAHNFVNEVRSSGVIPSPTGSHLSSLQSSPYPSPGASDYSQQSPSFADVNQPSQPVLQATQQPGNLELGLDNYSILDM